MRTWLLVLALVVAREAHAESYWLWAIDGRWEASKKPCTSELDQVTGKRVNPARQAVIGFIGDDTYVNIDSEGLSLTRNKALYVPQKRIVGPHGEPMAIWYRGARTWIVSAVPKVSPAFAIITLVIEKNEKREGAPVCYERWIAPVSP